MKAPYLHIAVLIAFLVNTFGSVPTARADPAFGGAGDFRLPAPGVMVPLSPVFAPPILKGIKVHPDNPFRFDFILDRGDSELNKDQIKDESNKLIKYFLASLTIPEKDLWVNLSPYEKDRIVPQSFGLTEMGRDLLAEDYMLKQITASLIYPEGKTGKKFWKRIYEEAAKRFGTVNIPVNTFNKVWIVPQKAVIYENAKAGTAYVLEAKLKVMLEEDYLSSKKHGFVHNGNSSIGANIVREIVIPELTKEINQGKNFVELRQVYNSIILAAWYKKKIKDSLLAQVYEDKRKVKGVESATYDIEAIYQRYLKAFKKGVFNFIKEEPDPTTQETIPRKYFSGGATFFQVIDMAQIVDQSTAGDKILGEINDETATGLEQVKVSLSNQAIASDDEEVRSVKELWNEMSNDIILYHGTSQFFLPDIKAEVEDQDIKPFDIKDVQIYQELYSKYYPSRAPLFNDHDSEAISATSDFSSAQKYAKRASERIANLLQVMTEMLNDRNVEIETEDRTVLENIHEKYIHKTQNHSPVVLGIKGSALKEAIDMPWWSSQEAFVKRYFELKNENPLVHDAETYKKKLLGELKRVTLRKISKESMGPTEFDVLGGRIIGYGHDLGNRILAMTSALKLVLKILESSNNHELIEYDAYYSYLKELNENVIDAQSFFTENNNFIGKMVKEHESISLIQEFFNNFKRKTEIRYRHILDNFRLRQDKVDMFYKQNELNPKFYDMFKKNLNRIDEVFKNDYVDFELQTMVNDVWHSFPRVKGITLEGNVLEQKTNIFSDKNKVGDILSNLINNAFDAFIMKGTSHSTIKIDAFTDSKNVTIEVTSNGGAMPKKIWDQILAGKKGEGVTTKKKKGNPFDGEVLGDQGIGLHIDGEKILGGQGIGLHNCLDNIRTLGGTIAMKSNNEDHTTTFIVTLPLGTGENKDNAQLSHEYGGIDFTANKTPLEIQHSGEGIKFHINPAMLAQLQNAPGFVPVIISIQPMINLRQFLGSNDDRPAQHVV